MRKILNNTLSTASFVPAPDLAAAMSPAIAEGGPAIMVPPGGAEWG